MNNKKLGTDFEREAVEFLSANGCWVHFITPDARGAQPFDIIASINDHPAAIDCKTSARKTFPLTRLEDNQMLAFDRWLACGNICAILLVKHDGWVYAVEYPLLKRQGKVDLTNAKEAARLWKSESEAN